MDHEVGQISSNGAYDLKLVTNSGTDSSYINIVDAANGNTQLYPNGTGLTEIGGATNPGTIQLNCEKTLMVLNYNHLHTQLVSHTH